MSDANRLKSIEHNGQRIFPVFFTVDGDNEPMIIFYDKPEDLMTYFPEIPPVDGLQINQCTPDMMNVAMHNLNVLNDRDLISLGSPTPGISWEQSIDKPLEIIDSHTGNVVCVMADNDDVEAYTNLVVQGRAALHFMHCLYTILQREAVYNPAEYRPVTDLLISVLEKSGYTNVMSID